MPRPSGAFTDRPRALFLSPEAPYPPVGGGALRSSALLEYLRRRFEVDVVTFAPGVPDSIHIQLPVHSRTAPARGWRQLRRLLSGRPPLLDRFSGFESEIEAGLSNRKYRVAVVEHFWCAPYAPILRKRSERLVLDLHNTESDLARTVAGSERWPLSVAFNRFAAAYERLERKWLPHFDAVLATNETEAAAARAGGACAAFVYPNTIPFRPVPPKRFENAVVFTGNLEYHPNISAVRWFAREIWPNVTRGLPGWEWRLVGKNPEAILAHVAGLDGVRIVGPVEDAVAEIARANIAVAPLLAGSGTRFKILEAWCAATAVVSTSLGAQGLQATDGRDLVLADGPGAFAQAIVALAGNPERRNCLGRHGREHWERTHTSEAGWRMLDESGLFRV